MHFWKLFMDLFPPCIKKLHKLTKKPKQTPKKTQQAIKINMLGAVIRGLCYLSEVVA